jgi:hypothetical protein
MKQIVSFVLLLLLFGSGVSPVYAKLWVNEFSSSGSSDWVEIYNDSDAEVSLSDYRLRDSSASNKLDLIGTISAKSFAAFEWSDRLNNSGDAIRLLKKNDESQIEDAITYGGLDGKVIDAPAVGQFAARKIDAGSEFALFASDSRGSTNTTASPLPNSTATPTETPKPTLTSKPTPTPTKVPTPTKTPTPVPGKSGTGGPTQKVPLGSVKSSTTHITPTIHYDMPTAVLAAKTGDDTGTSPSPHPTEAVKTLGVSSFNPAFFIIAAGIILLSSCGILVYLRYRKLRGGI